MHVYRTQDKPDEEHAEFDPASLREHEEFTKVKNINRIEIGKYDVETWCVVYFPNRGNGLLLLLERQC